MQLHTTSLSSNCHFPVPQWPSFAKTICDTPQSWPCHTSCGPTHRHPWEKAGEILRRGRMQVSTERVGVAGAHWIMPQLIANPWFKRVISSQELSTSLMSTHMWFQQSDLRSRIRRLKKRLWFISLTAPLLMAQIDPYCCPTRRTISLTCKSYCQMTGGIGHWIMIPTLSGVCFIVSHSWHLLIKLASVTIFPPAPWYLHYHSSCTFCGR